MGMLEDMLKVLDRFPAWKRLQQIPAELDGLKARVRNAMKSEPISMGIVVNFTKRTVQGFGIS